MAIGNIKGVYNSSDERMFNLKVFTVEEKHDHFNVINDSNESPREAISVKED